MSKIVHNLKSLPMEAEQNSNRQAAADPLQTARERLEIAVEGAGLGTWDWDILTGETIFNARWAEILGYELHEIEPHFNSWGNLLHPDDSSRVLTAVEEHLRGSKSVFQCEYRLRHRDGRWIWILAHGRVYARGEAGLPIRAAGIHKDITERKEAEEALLQSRETYKHTVELTTQIPWTARPDGSIIGIDPAWEIYTGLPTQAALSSDWLDAIHPDDQQRMFARWMHSVNTGEPYRVANRLRRRDGEYRHCESRAQPQRNEAGEIVRWYGTTEDIHDRTVAEQLLRSSEARRVLALEGAQLATWDWNLRTDEVIRDTPWFNMLGLPEEVTVRPADFWSERIHPEDLKAMSQLWNTHCQDETKPFRAEYRIRHESGEWRWILTHGRVVDRDDKGPSRACGINLDITERRGFEDALADRLKEEEERKREREERERLQTILENLNEGVIIVAPNGRLLLMNGAAQEMFGIEIARRDSIRYEDLFRSFNAKDTQGRDLSPSERPIARAAHGEAFSNLETIFQNRGDGREWIGTCSSTPVRSNSAELLLGVLTLRDITADRRAAEEVRRTNLALHELSAQLLRLQDDERKRIARELHDGTVQSLSAALINLTLLSDSPEVRQLDFESRLVSKCLTLTHQSVTELRTMSYLLHPPVLDELGLVPALRSWIDGFSDRTSIPVGTHMPEDVARLAPEVETTLFRITQEALGNVHRHAESSTAGVRLEITDGTIRLEITDDGKGFDESVLRQGAVNRRYGVGLLGMRERARQLGGLLQVDSRPGNTIVRVDLPRRPAIAGLP